MRLFAFPAALFLAFILYCAAPKLAEWLPRAFQKLYALFRRLDERAPRELDSGAYARDIPAYEALVRETCAALAPAFVAHVCAPLLLMAVGLPLRLSAALGWGFLALTAVSGENEQADRLLGLLVHPADAVFGFLLRLCCGVTGRNPFRTGGRGAQTRLMSILGIAQDDTDTHAPVSGDISQGTFLCCFCAVLLCLVLTLLLLPLVR